jgi:hypothetical protein
MPSYCVQGKLLLPFTLKQSSLQSDRSKDWEVHFGNILDILQHLGVLRTRVEKFILFPSCDLACYKNSGKVEYNCMHGPHRYKFGRKGRHISCAKLEKTEVPLKQWYMDICDFSHVSCSMPKKKKRGYLK